jgi:hypothetical protein
MKAFEFQASINPDRTLTIPQTVADQLPSPGAVRVIVLIDEDDEDRDWARLTSERFFQGYDEDDAVYDQL